MLLKKRIFLLPALLISLNITAQKRYVDESVLTGVDSIFSRTLQEGHAAGFAVAVVDKDSVIYVRGFGYRDYERKIPVTAQTMFAIGSCTKAFTAALIGILQDEGKINIDDPVRDYLPELKFYNIDMDAHITIRDMLCHRTGLPRYDLSWLLFPTRSKDSLLQRIRYFQPTAGVSKLWQYNNFMYLALGVLIEKVTGKTWEENVREKLFVPAGMAQSDLSLKAWTAGGEAALGYEVMKGDIVHKMKYYDIMGMSPAGAINSNVQDMGKWLITWIHSGEYRGKQVIPPAYAAQAMSAQMVIRPAMPDKEHGDIFLSDYGYGWMISSYRGHYRVEHGGNINGFSASASFFPSDSIGIVVLCNQNGSMVPAVVRNIIADRILHLEYRDWPGLLLEGSTPSPDTAQKKTPATTIAFHKPTHPLKDYEGKYANKGFGTFHVFLSKDSLFVLFPNGGDRAWLAPKNYDVFRTYYANAGSEIDTTNSNIPDMQFRMNNSGDIASVEWGIQPGVEPVIFSRVVGKAVLKKYTGNYVIDKMVIRITMDKDGRLQMVVPGQPKYDLVPMAEHSFSLKGVTGFSIQFELDDREEVTGLLSVQPNGTFEAKKEKTE